tara:strand:- start:159 stop:317 length:159 start_codon:yes stop_codon:yes gene_type:complete
MTEISWWYVGLFFVIILVFYSIGFISGKLYQQSIMKQEETKPKKPKRKYYKR